MKLIESKNPWITNMSKEEKTPFKIGTIPVEGSFEYPRTSILFHCDVCNETIVLHLDKDLICPNYDETHKINDIMRS